MSKNKAPQQVQQHDHDDPSRCACCAKLLLELQEISRLLRVTHRHEGARVSPQGICTVSSCWCRNAAVAS